MSHYTEKPKTASNEVAKAIANYKDFRHKEHKFLMLLMQTHGNSDGTKIHPGRALLAEQMDCSIRTITRYLHAILEDNLLIPEQKKGGKFTEVEYHTNNVKLKVRGYVTPETSPVVTPLETFIPEQLPEQVNGHVPPISPEQEPAPVGISYREYRQKLKEKQESEPLQNVPNNG